MKAWSASDVRGTAAALDVWWEMIADGADEPTLEALNAMRPPAPPLWDQTAVEAQLAALSAAGRAVAAAGFGMSTQSGTVAGLFVSDGGVPKGAVPSVRIGPTGLDGDRQKTRKHHGRVWQAVCLWSAEVVERLRAEGHPIGPGCAGENVLVADIAWRAVRPGARLRIGDALVEVSVPAIPCRQNRRWFTGGNIARMDHDRHPGCSRWYASVVEPGAVTTGDTVVVEPASDESPPRSPRSVRAGA